MLPPSSQYLSLTHTCRTRVVPTRDPANSNHHSFGSVLSKEARDAAPGNITHLLITLHRAAEEASACLPGDKHQNPRYILRRAVASKAQTKQSRPSSVCCAKLAVTNAHVGRVSFSVTLVLCS
eukprot:g9732.t1